MKKKIDIIFLDVSRMKRRLFINFPVNLAIQFPSYEKLYRKTIQ